VIEKNKNSSEISIKSELITHISFQSSEIMQSGVIIVLNLLSLSGIFGVLSLAFQRAYLSRILWWFGKQNQMGQCPNSL
jgi:hypothetical protein